MKNRKAMGTLQMQNVRSKSKPVIMEMDPVMVELEHEQLGKTFFNKNSLFLFIWKIIYIIFAVFDNQSIFLLLFICLDLNLLIYTVLLVLHKLCRLFFEDRTFSNNSVFLFSFLKIRIYITPFNCHFGQLILGRSLVHGSRSS